ncbi:unnamed protein product [Lathyrus oleraceus]
MAGLLSSWMTLMSPFITNLISSPRTSRSTILSSPRSSSKTVVVYFTLRWMWETTASNISRKDLSRMLLKELLHKTTRK